MRKFILKFTAAAAAAIRAPTQAQKKAYSSLCIALATACFVGGATALVTADTIGLALVVKSVVAFAWGLVLTLAGAILIKEE